MKTVNLTVNGKPVAARIEPRTHLADFLREHLNLTGTHLGCEHGVCGACTLLIDGAPVRSCITLAVACDGASITTIEGLDEDEIAAALRTAFSREHALQCGYCTPGMLAAARDVVLRMPAATAQEIRVAMSGNLCRCTGYVGVVRAIESVIRERREHAVPAPSAPLPPLGPLGSARARPTTGASAEAPPAAHAMRAPVAPASAARPAAAAASAWRPQTTLHESFTVDHPRATVWAFFARLGDIASCLPGTSVVGAPSDEHVDARIRVKAGPIVSEFDGAADMVRESADFSGVIHGAGEDARSRSAMRGEIRYRLIEDKNGAATRVDLEVGFTLTGPLAQFSRSNLVRDIARRMTEAFAGNLQARLSGRDAAAGSRAALDAGALILPALWQRIKAYCCRLFRR